MAHVLRTHRGDDAGGEAPAGGGDEGGGGLFSADIPQGELLTAFPATDDDEEEESTDEDSMIALSIDDVDAPIKAQNKIMNAFGQPIKNSRTVTSGPASTHMPDFMKMTSTGRRGRGQDTLNKPYDDDFLSNPFAEGLDTITGISPPRLTFDLVKTLDKMSSKIGISKTGLLSESDQDESE